MKDHILLIEDDLDLARLIKEFLTAEGYVLSISANALRARKLLQEQKFDLIICDVMLPGMDGFEFISQIRTSFSGPILFMTAQTQLSSQLRGLHIGAQDYLLKPVDPRLLLAKIKVFLRDESHAQTANSVICKYNLEWHADHKLALLDQKPLPLSNAEFILLGALIQNYGSVVSRESLFQEQLCRDYDGSDRTMDGRASRLRKKLQKIDPAWTIHTAWGQGYCLTYGARLQGKNSA